jgi:F420H(2)-dependent quinone reductase
MAEEKQERPLRGFLETLGRTRFGAWTILNIVTPIDNWLLKISNGRLNTFAGFAPVLLLTTTGAKSGLPRTVPLVFLRDGAAIVLMASNGGQPKHPAWYHNICANPTVQVTFGGETRSYIAREVHGAERERLWQRAVQFYRGYGDYQQRASNRTIPVVVLEPGGQEAGGRAS